MHYSRSVVISALLLLSACGSQDSSLSADAATSDADIVGGRTTTGFPNVGLLLNFIPGSNNGALCTATVVGPQKVLTAAHCVLALTANGGELPAATNPQNVVFYLGSSLNQTINHALVFDATSISLPGGNAFPFAQFVSNVESGVLNADDLAIVHVDRPIGVTPATVSTTPVAASQLGRSLTLVGYGTPRFYDGAGAGTKRYTTTPLTAFNDSLLEAGNSKRGTCSGDSGGPAFLGSVLVGITQAGSINSSGACVGDDVFTRADVWARFIQTN